MAGPEPFRMRGILRRQHLRPSAAASSIADGRLNAKPWRTAHGTAHGIGSVGQASRRQFHPAARAGGVAGGAGDHRAGGAGRDRCRLPADRYGRGLPQRGRGGRGDQVRRRAARRAVHHLQAEEWRARPRRGAQELRRDDAEAGPRPARHVPDPLAGAGPGQVCRGVEDAGGTEERRADPVDRGVELQPGPPRADHRGDRRDRRW